MAEFFTSKEHENFTSIWRVACETVTLDFKFPVYFFQQCGQELWTAATRALLVL